jgi:hypothetical protein
MLRVFPFALRALTKPQKKKKKKESASKKGKDMR